MELQLRPTRAASAEPSPCLRTVAATWWNVPLGHPVEGPPPTPSARLALIAQHDGQPDGYGAELAVDYLASTPDVRATVEVAATNSHSLTFVATRAAGG